MVPEKLLTLIKTDEKSAKILVRGIKQNESIIDYRINNKAEIETENFIGYHNITRESDSISIDNKGDYYLKNKNTDFIFTSRASITDITELKSIYRKQNELENEDKNNKKSEKEKIDKKKLSIISIITSKIQRES